MKYNNIYTLVLFLVFSNNALSESYIYKFTDSSGNVVYTDRVPADEKKEITVLSSKSGVIKKVIDKELSSDEIKDRDNKTAAEKVASEKSEMRKKKDMSLLSMYSNSEEIDKMKKYELDQIKLSIKNNTDNMALLNGRLDQLSSAQKTSPNDKFIQNEYEKTTNNINTLKQTIDKDNAMYSEREKKYDDDKTRYLQILSDMSNKQNVVNSSPDPEK